MKKGLMMAAVAAMMMIGTSAFAQDQMPKAEQMATKQSEKLKSELMLNDVQTKQVYEQLLWNIEQKREHAKQIAAKTDAAMKQVLTPEQYTKWAEIKIERMERAKAKVHKIGGKHDKHRGKKRD